MFHVPLNDLRAALMRIERVACIIERDAVSRANQMRAREIITLVEMAMRQMGDERAMAKQYVVTWYSAGADATFLTTVDGVLELTIEQIMEIACDVEDVHPEWGYDVYSIIRADNVDVIC